MKKEFVMISLILVLIIIGHFTTQNYSEKVFDELNKDLSNLRGKIVNENKNSEEIISSIKNITSKWQNEANILAYYTEHDELEKIGNKITVIKAGVEAEEYGETIMQIDECIFIVDHLKAKEMFRLVNIF